MSPNSRVKHWVSRLALAVACLLTNASYARAADPAPVTDTARLRQHLLALTATPQPRNCRHPDVLDTAAAYIGRQLRAAALPVKRFRAPAWLLGVDFFDHLNY